MPNFCLINTDLIEKDCVRLFASRDNKRLEL